MGQQRVLPHIWWDTPYLNGFGQNGFSSGDFPGQADEKPNVIPNAGEVTLNEVKTDGPGRLVMVFGQSARRAAARMCPSFAAGPQPVKRPSLTPMARNSGRKSSSESGASSATKKLQSAHLHRTATKYGGPPWPSNMPIGCRTDRIALALGGSAGARLAQQLGIVADGSTLLRGLRQRTRPVYRARRV